MADPLSSQSLTVAGYNELAARTAAFASGRGIGLVAVPEGGYNPQTLPSIDHSILAGFAGLPGVPSDPWSGGAAPGTGGSTQEGWAERLSHIEEVQRAWWPGAIRS